MWKNDIPTRTAADQSVERMIGGAPLGALIHMPESGVDTGVESGVLPAQEARIALLIEEIDGMIAELLLGKRKKDVEEEEELDDEEEDEEEDDLEEDEEDEDEDFDDEEDEDEFEEEFDDDELDDDDDDIFYDDDDDE